VIASVDEAGEYVINTQFDHNGKSSITHSVDAEITLTIVLPLCFPVASISTGGSRKSFASSIRNLVEV
jgi:hypothetical protein